MTNTTIKFVAMTEEVQAAVIWADDVEALIHDNGMTEAIDTIMDRVFAGDLKVPGAIHVIDDNKELAQNLAAVLNANYTKEMELMKEANIVKEEVSELVEASIKAGKPSVDEDKNAAARAFLEENGAAIVNSKKSTKKEEKEMETKKVTGRRRISTGAAKQEQTKTTNEKVETKMTNRKAEIKEEVKVTGTRRRVSSGKKAEVAGQTKVAEGRKRIKRTASLRSEFKKHEGQWWSNVELYPEVALLPTILEDDNMACPELGIETIVFAEHTEISRYRNRTDIEVVIQIKSNGSVLEFPIKEASANSKSPLTSTSIGWVEYNGKVRPAFGFWRPNALDVEMTCGCGKKFKANTGNVYCPSCKTRHDDVEIAVEHSSLDFASEVQGWVFQEVPNLVVPKATLALVMALAHYDAGYDVDGLVEEDAE